MGFIRLLIFHWPEPGWRIISYQPTAQVFNSPLDRVGTILANQLTKLQPLTRWFPPLLGGSQCLAR
jgi:hypothetical protein